MAVLKDKHGFVEKYCALRGTGKLKLSYEDGHRIYGAPVPIRTRKFLANELIQLFFLEFWD
ncbi:MAG: hypothetical protein ACTSXU_13970 [Promethearchaeota archaeon]